MITPDLIPKLRDTSKTFQRIKYLHMKFTAVTQVPSSIGGGYVLAVVPDPNDVISVDENPLDVLMSQYGARTTKMWESTSATLTATGDVLYTSPGPDTRLYSPGRLVLAVDGKATQPGSITVTCDWKVELSVPGISINPVRGTTITCVGWIYALSNGTLDVYDNVWDAQSLLDDKPTTNPKRIPLEDAIPGFRTDRIYRLLSPKTADVWDSARGLVDNNVIQLVHIISTSNYSLFENPFLLPLKKAPSEDPMMVISPGEVLVEFSPVQPEN